MIWSMDWAALLPAPMASVIRPIPTASPMANTLESEVRPDGSTLTKPSSNSSSFPRKERSGTSPMETTTVVAGKISPSSSLTPLAMISLVKTGQRNFAPQASASSFSLPNAAGFCTSIRVISLAPRRWASVATSQPTLPAPMITIFLPGLTLSALACSRKSLAYTARSMPFTGSVLGFLAPAATTVKSKSFFIL